MINHHLPILHHRCSLGCGAPLEGSAPVAGLQHSGLDLHRASDHQLSLHELQAMAQLARWGPPRVSAQLRIKGVHDGEVAGGFIGFL